MNGSDKIVVLAIGLFTLYTYAIIQLVISFSFNTQNEVMFRFSASIIAFEIPNYYQKSKNLSLNHTISVGKIDKHLDFIEYSQWQKIVRITYKTLKLIYLNLFYFTVFLMPLIYFLGNLTQQLISQSEFYTNVVSVNEWICTCLQRICLNLNIKVFIYIFIF